MIKVNSPAHNLKKNYRPSVENYSQTQLLFGSREKLQDKGKEVLQNFQSYKSSRANFKSNPNEFKIFISQELKPSKDSFEPSHFGNNRVPQNIAQFESRKPDCKQESLVTTNKSLSRKSNYCRADQLNEEFSSMQAINCRTFGVGQRSLCRELSKNLNGNVLNYMTLFSKKRSVPENNVKLNIEKSIKGMIIRKIQRQKLSDAL